MTRATPQEDFSRRVYPMSGLRHAKGQRRRRSERKESKKNEKYNTHSSA